MPASINGIGTRFYGASSPRADGSVITTRWFTILYIPIIPLSSCRLIHLTGADTYQAASRSSYYTLVEKLPIQWLQVLKTYVFTLCYFGWIVAIGSGCSRLYPDSKPPVSVLWVVPILFPVPLYVLLGLRKLESSRTRKKP